MYTYLLVHAALVDPLLDITYQFVKFKISGWPLQLFGGIELSTVLLLITIQNSNTLFTGNTSGILNNVRCYHGLSYNIEYQM